MDVSYYLQVVYYLSKGFKCSPKTLRMIPETLSTARRSRCRLTFAVTAVSCMYSCKIVNHKRQTLLVKSQLAMDMSRNY